MQHPNNFHLVAKVATPAGDMIDVMEAVSFQDFENYIASYGEQVLARPAMYPAAKFSRQEAIADYKQWCL